MSGGSMFAVGMFAAGMILGMALALILADLPRIAARSRLYVRDLQREGWKEQAIARYQESDAKLGSAIAEAGEVLRRAKLRVLLRLLVEHEKPGESRGLYGLEIIEAMPDMFSRGTVYVHLAALADAGFVRSWSDHNPETPRMLFAPTDAGREAHSQIGDRLTIEADAFGGKASS